MTPCKLHHGFHQAYININIINKQVWKGIEYILFSSGKGQARIGNATMPTSARYCACPDCHISIHAKANTDIHAPAFLVVTSILTWCRIVSGYFRLRAKHSTFQDKKIRVKKSSSTSLGRKKKPWLLDCCVETSPTKLTQRAQCYCQPRRRENIVIYLK